MNPSESREHLRASLQPLKPLSVRERDRRWAAARQLMGEQNVEALLIFSHERLRPDHWLTNDLPAATLLFPREGEPTGMMFEGVFAGAMLEAELRGEAAWIKDWRFRKKPFKVVELIREKGLERARIGVIGAAGGPKADAGWVSFTDWSYILEQLPDATFTDLWGPYAELMSVKSDEELALFRRAAAVAEVACERFLDAAQPGVSEAELYATVQREILRLGARSTTMVLHAGAGFPRAGAPKWQQRSQPVRVLRNGDVVTAGVFPLVANIEAQAHVTSCLESMPDDVTKCLEIAHESYRVGLQTVRPGIPFGRVAAAMEEPIRRSGAWYLTPLVFTLNPMECVGSACVGVDALPGVERYRGVKAAPAKGRDTVLKAGMLLQLAPNACIGGRRAVIGGNVIVTATGAEGLNVIPFGKRGSSIVRSVKPHRKEDEK